MSPALVRSQLHHCCHCCCWLRSLCCPAVVHGCCASAAHLQLALHAALLHMLSNLHTGTQRCWLRAQAKHVSSTKLSLLRLIIATKSTSLGAALAGTSGSSCTSTRVDGQLTRCGAPASAFVSPIRNTAITHEVLGDPALFRPIVASTLLVVCFVLKRSFSRLEAIDILVVTCFPANHSASPFCVFVLPSADSNHRSVAQETQA